AVVLLPGNPVASGESMKPSMNLARGLALFTATLLLPPVAVYSDGGEPKTKAAPKPLVRKDVKFTTAGKEIAVWQYVPGEGNGPWPGMVLLHGIEGLDPEVLQKDFEARLLYDQLGSRIAQLGYVVHLVHYCNCTPFNKNEAKKVEEALLKHIHVKDERKPDPTIEDCYPLWMATSREGVKFLRQCK